MQLEIKKGSENYACSIVKLPVKQKVEGLDNLVKVTIFGNDILTQKSAPEDELYLFFPAECAISKEYLFRNNEFREVQLNEDKSKKGYFEPSGRVKAVKFKGVISTGYLAPIDTLVGLLSVAEVENLREGDEFTDIDGTSICEKYVIKHMQSSTPGEPKDKSFNKLSSHLIRNQFRLHQETSHLAKNLHHLHPEDIIVITDKWHGSSVILAKVLVKKQLTWYQRLLNKIGGQISDSEYGWIYSSGKPKSGLPKGIEGSWVNTNQSFYDDNIWKILMDEYKHTLEDGISLYGEVVGFTPSGKTIQKGYDYGCISAGISPELQKDIQTHKFLVYRITYTKPDGSVIEFSWQQIKNYCQKYQLEHVKELYFGRAKDHTWNGDFDDRELLFVETWREIFFNDLSQSWNLEKDCSYCVNKVPAEGIVVRRDGQDTYSAYKLKSKRFLERETKQLDEEAKSGETNIEEQ